MNKPSRLINWPEVSPTWNQTSEKKTDSSQLRATANSGNRAADEAAEEAKVDAVTVIRADYGNPAHAAALDEVLSAYAMDIMGGGEALQPQVRRSLVRSPRVGFSRKSTPTNTLLCPKF
jgi:hypothetical protein